MPDRLTERFAHLAEDVAARARPRPASAVRARGRVRTKRLAATGLAVAGLVVATVVAMVGLSPADAGPHRSSYPGGTGDDPGATRPPLVMPHEGEAGWVRSDDVNKPGAFNPCSTVDVTLAGRTAAYTMTATAIPYGESGTPTTFVDQLLVYSTVDKAHAVVQQLEAAMHQCDWAGGFTPETEFDRVGFNGFYPSNRFAPHLTDVRDVMVTTRRNAVIIIYDRVTANVIPQFETWPLYMMAYNACDSLGICEAPTCPTALSATATDGPMTCPGAESVPPAYPDSGPGPDFTPGSTENYPTGTGTPDISGPTP